MTPSRLLANRPLVAVFVGAALVVGLVVGSGYHTRQLMNRHQVVDGLVQGVTEGVAQSHLWLDEYLTGGDDPGLPGAIRQRLAAALGACTTLRAGGRVGGQRVEPLPEEARSPVTALCDRVAVLQELTDSRMAAPATHGAGSDLGEDYDAVFTETLAAADRVDDAVHEMVQARRAGLAGLFAALVTAVVVTSGLMGVTVSRHARQLRQSSRRHRESEAWFRTLVHGASDLIAVLDARGSLVYANPVAEDTLGFSPAEETGRNLFDHVHPDDRQRTIEEFATWLRRPGAAHPWVFRFASADGGWRTLEATWTNCLDDPAVAGVVVNARDVTETQQSRDALGASEAFLREAQGLARLGSFDSDFSTGVVSWSEELHTIMGTDRDAFSPTHDSFLAAVHEEDRSKVEAAVAEAFAENVEYACKFRVVRPDGTVRVLHARGTVVTDEGPDPTRLIGAAQDITDDEELRRALDAQLRHVTCLAAVRRAVYELDEVAEVCAAAVAALAPAMSHPDLAVATVGLDGRRYCSSGEIAGAGEQLTAAVVIAGATRGQVQVTYPCASATFLPEEQDLVQSVADKLALGLERHESQAALAESEARFRRLVDNIPDVVFRYRLGDAEGIDYVSPAVEALTGYGPEEFLAHPELVTRILVAGPDDAADPGGSPSPETQLGRATRQLVARDGSVRFVERNIAAVHDEHGTLVAFEGVAHDVTKRTAAEQALEQRVREHAALARFGEAALTSVKMADLFDLAAVVVKETLPVDAVGVSELRPDTGELLVSSGTGWPAGVVGTMRLPLDTGSLAAAAIARNAPVVVADLADAAAPDAPFLAAQGMVSGMSVVIGGRDGPYGTLGAFSARPQEYSGAQVRFLQTLAHLLGAAIERTTAEAALAVSEREFRTLAEQMPDIVARYGRDHRYRYVNSPVQALLGISPSEMIGRTNRELGMSAAVVGVWEDAHELVFATGEPTTIEGVYPGVEGATHLQSLLIPEFDSLGAVCAVISVSRDITELRRTEEQRRDGLVRIVAAQEAERGRIGEDIHDDSIQVMTAVGMRLAMLEYQTTEPEALDLLARLAETVRHAIDRLRALMFELLPPELDRDGLSATLKLYLESTATDGLPLWELVNNCPRELPAEIRVVLYRIAVEAIVNARKHAQASLLCISLDEVDDGVRLHVRDDGHGFDTSALAHVGPHHVGMATMRGRAAAADGTVDIHSAPGEGTVVSAWLPWPVAAPVAS